MLAGYTVRSERTRPDSLLENLTMITPSDDEGEDVEMSQSQSSRTSSSLCSDVPLEDRSRMTQACSSKSSHVLLICERTFRWMDHG